MPLLGAYDDDAVLRFNDGEHRWSGEHRGRDAIERFYANRTVLVLPTRWGKIVEQEDFYEDTSRMLVLEQALRERGIHPVAEQMPG